MRELKFTPSLTFKPLWFPARYKGAHGGRGSGKSHNFAEMLVLDSLREPGLRSVCIREVQKDLTQSAKILIEDKIAKFGLTEADGFKIFKDSIQTPGDGLIIFKGMQDYTAESIKSLEGFKRAWWEEAQTATAHSLSLLRPTIREEGSELWFSWNPRFEDDPVDVMLRGRSLPTGAVVVEANWDDNPWLPGPLKQERLDCLNATPDQYDHIWQGGYVSVIEGAYFAKDLAQAKAEGRIGHLAADPLMAKRAFWDIGGTGARSDACSIWIGQFVGTQIRVLDYYEAQGQPLATHVTWLREHGYGNVECFLPHDGAQGDKVHATSYESALRDAGFSVTVVPNQGVGAAKARIEAARRVFPSIWFNDEKTNHGRKALGWYHERKDPVRKMGLGPEHDWSSHGADAFGLLCISYEEPRTKRRGPQLGAGSWMG
jgi:phage terminase large subunit